MNRSVIPGMLHCVLCGYAAFLPFARSIPDAGANWSATPAMMFGGPFLVGAGAGAVLLANVSRRHGSHWAARLSLLYIAGSLLVHSFAPMSERAEWHNAVSAAACFLAGLGFCGLWSPTAELLRDALSTTQRWFGLRIWSLMLFVGALLVIVVTLFVDDSIGAAAWIPAAVCGVLIPFIRQFNDRRTGRPKRPEELPSDAFANDPPQSKTHSLELTSEAGDHNATRDPAPAFDDCGAEECCGGNRDWLPVPLWVGAGLAAVGAMALWVLLADVFAQQDLTGRLLLIAGAILGTWLFQSTLPDTGYAILLLPFLLLGLFLWLGMAWFASARDYGIAVLVLGATLGAISYGCTGLVCESFEESCRGIRQATVFLIGHMAATAMLALLALRSLLWQPAFEYDAWRAIVFPAAVVMLRCIPSPVISNRGRDEAMDAEDAAEAAAVLADTVRISEAASLTDTVSLPNASSTAKDKPE